jgi:hypothetical protein
MACSPSEMTVSLGGTESAQEWHWEAGVRGSVSMNYGKSRMSQMLAELVLPFSVSRLWSLFFQESRKEAKNKQGKMAFQ